MVKPSPQRTRHFPRFLLGLVYLLSISGLILWEFRDRLSGSSVCDGIDAEAKTPLYSYPYRAFLDWSHGDSASQVSVVAIPADREDIQGNVCLGRSYLADLLRAAAVQHPSEIVVDKFFGPATCNSAPESTAELLDVVKSLPIPVVVGESTNLNEKSHAEACLIRKPQLDFHSDNVHRGLTRMNSESERVPMAWEVESVEKDGKIARTESADSLSWTAVKTYDPDYAHRERIQSVLNIRRPPFAKVNIELARQTSTDLLCATGTDAMKQRWNLSCGSASHSMNLLGRIVVIGAEDDKDKREVLGEHMWGFDLQARYIQAMLSGSYLRATPFWLDFLLFGSFIFIIEGLPTILEAYRPHWKKHPFLSRAFQRRRYVWVGVCTVAIVLLVSAIALVLGFLPPLAVFGDILLVSITRLLFFAAESTEAPFLHGATKGIHR